MIGVNAVGESSQCDHRVNTWRFTRLVRCLSALISLALGFATLVAAIAFQVGVRSKVKSDHIRSE